MKKKCLLTALFGCMVVSVSYTHLDVYKRQIQAFQECVHSQSYSYMLDSICSPEKRNEILYQWKTDGHLSLIHI